jgi:hypothetical protein
VPVHGERFDSPEADARGRCLDASYGHCPPRLSSLDREVQAVREIPAHLSLAFAVKEGVFVQIGECRPLSKTVHFNLIPSFLNRPLLDTSIGTPNPSGDFFTHSPIAVNQFATMIRRGHCIGFSPVIRKDHVDRRLFNNLAISAICGMMTDSNGGFGREGRLFSRVRSSA